MELFRKRLSAGITRVTSVELQRSEPVQPTDRVLGTMPEDLQRFSSFYQKTVMEYASRLDVLEAQATSMGSITKAAIEEIVLGEKNIDLMREILMREINQTFGVAEKLHSSLVVRDDFIIALSKPEAVEVGLPRQGFRSWLEESLAGVTDETCAMRPLGEGEVALTTLSEDHQRMWIFLRTANDKLSAEMKEHLATNHSNGDKQACIDLMLRQEDLDLAKEVFWLEVKETFGGTEPSLGIREAFQVARIPPKPMGLLEILFGGPMGGINLPEALQDPERFGHQMSAHG